MSAPQWKSDNEGGHELDLGYVLLSVEPLSIDGRYHSCTAICRWRDDYEAVRGGSVEEAKAAAVALGIAHLTAAIDELKAVKS